MFLRTHEIKIGEVYLGKDGFKYTVVKSYQGEYPVFQGLGGNRLRAEMVDIDRRIVDVDPPEVKKPRTADVSVEAVERIVTLARAVDSLADAYAISPTLATKEAQEEVSELISLIAGREIDKNDK